MTKANLQSRSRTSATIIVQTSLQLLVSIPWIQYLYTDLSFDTSYPKQLEPYLSHQDFETTLQRFNTITYAFKNKIRNFMITIGGPVCITLWLILIVFINEDSLGIIFLLINLSYLCLIGLHIYRHKCMLYQLNEMINNENEVYKQYTPQIIWILEYNPKTKNTELSIGVVASKNESHSQSLTINPSLQITDPSLQTTDSSLDTTTSSIVPLVPKLSDLDYPAFVPLHITPFVTRSPSPRGWRSSPFTYGLSRYRYVDPTEQDQSVVKRLNNSYDQMDHVSIDIQKSSE